MQALAHPLNYRHAFHAGNFADVFKHALVVALLEALTAKPAPLCYLETHAGRGSYDLGGAQAKRTGEADEGVLRLLAAAELPDCLSRYAELLRAGIDTTGARVYPGSPALARALLRADDELILCELQPEEATVLKRACHGDRRCHVHVRDGYSALDALLPPAQRRGLVLIDSSFEAQKSEFKLIESALKTALERWPNGRFAVWYPIKLAADVAPFRRWLREHVTLPVLDVELLHHRADTALQLNGCGMALINPPWHFAGTAGAITTALRRILCHTGYSAAQVSWLRPRA